MDLGGICRLCKWWRPGIGHPQEKQTCAAFPEEIPESIWSGDELHLEPTLSTSGVYFEPAADVTPEYLDEWLDLWRVFHHPSHAPFKHVGLDEPYGPEVTLSHADPVAVRRSIWEEADDSFRNFHPAYVEIFEWSLILRLRSVFRDIGTLIASGASYPAGWGSLQADCSIDSIAWSARDSLEWSERIWSKRARQSLGTGTDDWDDWSDRIASAVIIMGCGPDIAMGDFDFYLGPKIAAVCTGMADQSDYESLAAMAWMGVMTGLSNGIDLSPGEFATHLPATAERLQAVGGRNWESP